MGNVYEKSLASSHPPTYHINKTLKGDYSALMYGKHTEAVRAAICFNYFINNEVYKYPDYLHMATAGGETRTTTTIGCVYTINRCIEKGALCRNHKGDCVARSTKLHFVCSAANVFAGVGGGCSHQNLFVNM